MPRLFTPERLLAAWCTYRRGKRRVAAVQAFELRREEEIARLGSELAGGRYQHGAYRSFTVFDPKCRTITVAPIRDRIVHQVVSDELERAFEPTFLDCSYSSRKGRGVHAAAMRASQEFARLRSRRSWPIWALKGDVRKFYDSIDHEILLRLVRRRIRDEQILAIIEEIVGSYHSPVGSGKGLPIGNLTSQILANTYLHELDRFAKHTLHLPAYFRYADDFLLIGTDPSALTIAAERIERLLNTALKLSATHTHTHTAGLENSHGASTGSERYSGRTVGRCGRRREIVYSADSDRLRACNCPRRARATGDS